jgi:hypothetical protein
MLREVIPVLQVAKVLGVSCATLYSGLPLGARRAAS